jgi:hypothetical protein
MPRVPPPSGPEGTVWFGGEPENATLCLRVCGDELDPEEVTRLMGRAPTRSQRKGQPVLDSSGQVKRLARTGSWLLDFCLSPEATIAEGIESLLGSLANDKELWVALGKRFRVDCLCDVSIRGVNQGFVLPAQTLEMLTERNIELGVDIYCECDEDQTAALRERLGTADASRPPSLPPAARRT